MYSEKPRDVAHHKIYHFIIYSLYYFICYFKITLISAILKFHCTYIMMHISLLPTLFNWAILINKKPGRLTMCTVNACHPRVDGVDITMRRSHIRATVDAVLLMLLLRMV